MPRCSVPADAPRLFPGHYRCDRCNRDVDAISRYRGWRLCSRCVERIVPSVHPLRGGDGVVNTEPERAEMLRFVAWDERRRRWKPKRYRPARPLVEAQHFDDSDSYFPLCECGAPREEYAFTRRPRGLFGGPFQSLCPVCEARRMVEDVTSPRWQAIHPDWGDEDWLDHLYRSFPEAFEVGVLPDYWYKLRRNTAE